MLSSPKAPRALVDTFLPLVQARAIIAGVSLGVFEALRDGGHSCEERGQSLSLDVEALELVLRMLVGADYLVREGDRYALTDAARQTLLDGARARVVAYVGRDEMKWDWLGHTNDVRRPAPSPCPGVDRTNSPTLAMPHG